MFSFLKKSLFNSRNSNESNVILTKEREPSPNTTTITLSNFKNKTPKQIFEEEYTKWIDSGEETAQLNLVEVQESKKQVKFTFGFEENSPCFYILYPPDFPLSKDYLVYFLLLQFPFFFFIHLLLSLLDICFRR